MAGNESKRDFLEPYPYILGVPGAGLLPHTTSHVFISIYCLWCNHCTKHIRLLEEGILAHVPVIFLSSLLPFPVALPEAEQSFADDICVNSKIPYSSYSVVQWFQSPVNGTNPKTLFEY